MRRCRTQLRCRTLRCTLRFAKSVSLASLLGESLLLRHEMQSCLTRRVAFFFAQIIVLTHIDLRRKKHKCVALQDCKSGRRPEEQRDVCCQQQLTSSSPPTPETLLFSRVSCYFKIELSHAVQQPSKHLLGTAV